MPKNLHPQAIALLMLLALAAAHAARAADDDDKTIYAQQVLDLIYSPTTLRDSFSGLIDPALEKMKDQGMPEAARDEARRAFIEWFDQEVKWADIEPGLVKVYTQDFSEDELRMLLNILQKPLGQSVISKLPLVMRDGSLVGREYFQSKEASLDAKLGPIMAKYRDKMKAPN
jgi:hypothetical protein